MSEVQSSLPHSAVITDIVIIGERKQQQNCLPRNALPHPPPFLK